MNKVMGDKISPFPPKYPPVFPQKIRFNPLFLLYKWAKVLQGGTQCLSGGQWGANKPPYLYTYYVCPASPTSPIVKIKYVKCNKNNKLGVIIGGKLWGIFRGTRGKLNFCRENYNVTIEHVMIFTFRWYGCLDGWGGCDHSPKTPSTELVKTQSRKIRPWRHSKD